MMKLGICTDGCEEAFERRLKQVEASAAGQFVYCEIGVAQGTTIKAVRQACPNAARLIAFDVPESDMAKWFSGRVPKGIELHLEPSGVQNGALHLVDPKIPHVDFAFIDGCHGKSCVKKDFEAVEMLIRHGGIVCFHDSCEEDQGVSFQFHCGEPINVRAGLIELGLIHGTRPGWSFIEEAHGNKAVGGLGMCFFQRL